MSRVDNTIYCDGCGVEITWSPIIIERRDYCCQDCLEVRPCKCGERTELDEDRRAGGGEDE
jgi:hypothetical protein